MCDGASSWRVARGERSPSQRRDQRSQMGRYDMMVVAALAGREDIEPWGEYVHAWTDSRSIRARRAGSMPRQQSPSSQVVFVGVRIVLPGGCVNGSLGSYFLFLGLPGLHLCRGYDVRGTDNIRQAPMSVGAHALHCALSWAVHFWVEVAGLGPPHKHRMGESKPPKRSAAEESEPLFGLSSESGPTMFLGLSLSGSYISVSAEDKMTDIEQIFGWGQRSITGRSEFLVWGATATISFRRLISGSLGPPHLF
ncbi:hypothetical protein K438DRAFT_1748280 [Mycena galopus ATCC 62051]|nr:hypothetical protein K438DRAFT_1748280 [Mycena galopus ATCC 62051]